MYFIYRTDNTSDIFGTIIIAPGGKNSRGSSGNDGVLRDKRILYTECRGKPLREHIELRGFLPLMSRYEVQNKYVMIFLLYFY